MGEGWWVGVGGGVWVGGGGINWPAILNPFSMMCFIDHMWDIKSVMFQVINMYVVH